MSEIESRYPLTPMQQGMLFHTLYAPGTGVDLVQILFDLDEDLHFSAMERAWQRVVDRHPALRTSFRSGGLSGPSQEIHRQARHPAVKHDWRELSAAEQEDRFKADLESDRKRGFVLTEAPLSRLALYRLADTRWKMTWTLHHILMDGNSFPIILREVFGFYESYRQDRDPEMPPPPSYKKHLEWIGRYDPTGSRSYWEEILEGFQKPTSFGVGGNHGSSLHRDATFPEREFHLSATATEALQSFTEEQALTLTTLVQGAWALLLSRYSDGEDVLFGATRACRRSIVEGVESMVGLLINTLPLRVRVPDRIPALEWLKGLHAQWRSMRDHEQTPLFKIKEWSDIPGSDALFESIVVFDDSSLHARMQSLGGNWDNRRISILEQTNYPLTLAAYGGSELRIGIQYDALRFKDETIDRMLEHLQVILESIVEKPGSPLGEIPILTERERHTLVVDWNDTEREYPRDASVHQLFEDQAKRTPRACAAACKGHLLTYEELNGTANRLARHLRGLGVGPGSLVGIFLERSLEMTICMLGILKAGGAYLPLDQAYPSARLKVMLDDSATAVVLTRRPLKTALPACAARIVCLDDDRAAIASENSDNPGPLANASDTAYAIFTSGSTGKPKCVLVPHRALVNHSVCMGRRFGLTPTDRVLQFASISFDVAAEEIFPAWLTGAAVVIRPNRDAISFREFQRTIDQEELTVLNLPAAYWHGWVEEMSRTSVPPPSGIRLVIVGSEAVSPVRLEMWRKIVPAHVRWINAYGPTETTITATTFEPSDHLVGDDWRTVPIGRPIDNTKTYVLDSRGRLAPIGVPGELYIGGDGLAKGYLNRPELTSAGFVPNPFSRDPYELLYRTGDRVRFHANGNLEFLGRTDHQVKIRGYRVELGEIEAALGRHAGTREAVVLAREDESGARRLFAYIVCDPAQPPTAGVLRDHLKTMLPDYMIPVGFIILDSMPRTTTGKVDRRALAAADKPKPGSEEAYVAPRTPVEMKLAGIWSDILGIERIGVDDNFFHLGGHSLLATQALSHMCDAFDIDLPLLALFEEPTVAGLARRIETTSTSDLHPDGVRSRAWSCLIPIQSQGEKKPFFIVAGAHADEDVFLRFLSNLIPYLGTDQPVYGFKARGLDGKEKPHTSVERMAADYIMEMRAFFPEGPYLLSGECVGGNVAYEMAQQLRAAGSRVALLLLMDTDRPTMWFALMSRLRNLHTRVRQHFGRLREGLSRNPFTLVRSLIPFIRRLSTRVLPMNEEDRTQKHIRQVEEAYPKTMLRYRPKPYPGKLTLIINMEENRPDSTLGWRKVAAGGLELHFVPGNHVTRMTEHAEVTGTQVRSCLKAVHAQLEKE